MEVWLGFTLLLSVPFLIAFAVFIVLEGLIRILYKMTGETPPPFWSSKK